MSTAMSISPRRNLEAGKLNFTNDWHWDTEYEKLAATGVAEAIENNFEHTPPCMTIDTTDDDIVVGFGLGLLSETGGPAWHFSLKDALNSVTECNVDDVRDLIQRMRQLADYAETLLRDDE